MMRQSWRVTRRDFLRRSGLAAAGLARGLSLAHAGEDGRKTIRSFGMVTDAHYADRDPGGSRIYRESIAKMTECVKLMNEKKVDFLIELGDLKDQGHPASEETSLGFLTEIEMVLGRFKGPRYHVLGNHDVDSISKQQFLDRVENTGIQKEASYYSFDSQGVHLVVLDACFTSQGADYDHGKFGWKDANIPPRELEWLKQDLASTTKPVIAFVHQLLDGEGGHTVKNAAEVRQILRESKNVLAVFQGHQHGGQYSHIEGIHYYTLPAMVEGSGEKHNAYAVVDVHDDNSLTVTGYRKAVSKELAKA